MRRIYHDYRNWEDYKAGMYGAVKKEVEQKLINEARKFMANTNRFASAMNAVTLNWKHSCEHNLTNPYINKRAWLGQAACAFKIGTPENIVRQSWTMLTELQREAANERADYHIYIWTRAHINKAEQLSIW